MQRIAPVHQGDAGGWTFAQGDGRIKCCLLRPDHQRIFCSRSLAGHQPVVHLLTLKNFQPGQMQAPRGKCAHATGNKHSARQKVEARRGFCQIAPIGLPLQGLHGLVQVHARREGCNLRQKILDQLAPGADLDGGNIVNRLIGVEGNALTARHGQGVHHLRMHALKAQLKHLKQPHRARTDDQRVGLQGLGWQRPAPGQRISSESLSVLSFHSSASGKGVLRLVMLFQVGSLASSALRAVMWRWSCGTSSSA